MADHRNKSGMNTRLRQVPLKHMMGLQEIEWVILGRFCLLAKGWIEMVERLPLRPLGERLRLRQ